MPPALPPPPPPTFPVCRRRRRHLLLFQAAAAARRYTPQQQQAQPQLQHHQSQLGTVPQLLAGGVAGAVSKTCTARLARLTILFQVCLGSKESSFRAFWKGNLVTIAHRLPYSSISFYAYERYKNLLQMLPGLEKNGGFSADVGVRLLGGGLSGVTAASMTYPLDLVRTRLAAQTNIAYYRGISHALFAICRDEDFRGLYKVTFPLDLVRRRMQLEGAGGRARVYHTGLFGTFGHIVRTEGFRGLYRGILPDEYCKVVPGVGIVFMTYEMLKAILTGLESDD
ncbi:hypothetical protein SEVIR_8G114851v4 [Setaria viridis]